jgi:hypothetical protein
VVGQAVGRLLFLKKKKQKKFVNLGHGRWRPRRAGGALQAFFAAVFQKRSA